MDVIDAFNTVNREGMLCNTGIIRPTLYRFATNLYKDNSRLTVTEDEKLRSEEGITQGDHTAKAT